MQAAQRVVLNTIAQYIRTIINICLSLYSTRLVLGALGESDYGIYSLVGGVVAMLGFITNAMVVATQRHLSFAYGEKNPQMVRTVFSNSFFLHFIIGIILVVALMSITSLLFNGFLNVDISRIDVAKRVYYITIFILFFTFLAAPYRGLLIARENIIYISIVDILDGVIKLLLVLFLLVIDVDKLFVYSLMMLLVTLFNYAALAIYAVIKYDECLLLFHTKLIDKSILNGFVGFAIWTTYSTGCIIARTQGIAIILNSFFGTIINASYGIAMQLSGAVQFVALSIQNAISPQIVKAEGAKKRNKMLYLSEVASKYSFLLLILVSVPLIFEMPAILNVWLGNVPDYAVTFCRFILATIIVDQLTIGLGIANQAVGRIRNYSLAINTTKVLTLPAVWLCLHIGFPAISVMWCYIIIEFICAMIRLPFLKYTAGLSVIHFIQNVFVRSLIPLLVLIIFGWFMTTYVNMHFRFAATFVLSILLDIPFIWFFGFSSEERNLVKSMIHSGYLFFKYDFYNSKDENDKKN